ncbi:MAG TPA: DUF229 domain-containing protein [Planctomycetes bacterium]|nr:DUF229 domain-containing protein [Planctomycetota bacterium]
MTQRPSIQPILPVALSLLAACGPGSDEHADTSPAAPRNETPPNVLVVTMDTTRADYLGMYEPERAMLSPKLDAFAEEATVFELAIATASVTPVAHAAILTGRWNRDHGLRVITADGGYRLPDDVPTLATLLKRAGYATAAIQSSFTVSSYFGLGQGIDEMDDFDAPLFETDDGEYIDWKLDQFQRRSDETADRAISYLDRTPEPFFLWLHFWDPHDKDILPPGCTATKQPAIYRNEIRYMDSQIHRVFEHLREQGRWDDTIVVVVSDHGQGLRDHGWFGHRTLHQEQIHVPLMIRVPGAQQKGRVASLVRSIDILPTILDYLGMEVPEGTDGRSLRPLMEGREDEPRVAFADQINRFDRNAKMMEQKPLDDFLYCAMDATWKLTYRPTHPDLSELYNIAEDPKELNNLYAKRPEEVSRLLTMLSEEDPWVTQPFAPLESDGEGRDAALSALSALGYAAGGDAPPEAGELRWEWFCPSLEHESVSGEAGRCPECGLNLVPRAEQ